MYSRISQGIWTLFCKQIGGVDLYYESIKKEKKKLQILQTFYVYE